MKEYYITCEDLYVTDELVKIIDFCDAENAVQNWMDDNEFDMCEGIIIKVHGEGESKTFRVEKEETITYYAEEVEE